VAMRNAISQVMANLMIDGVHFGVMPGTEDKKDRNGKPLPPKKCLFKAGAEVLCNAFRLRPEYHVVSRVEEPTFIHCEVECRIVSISTGETMATGVGSANTREDRYHNQCTSKVCPQCNKATIFRSKRPPAEFFCWEAKGGCGAEFMSDQRELLEQSAQLNQQKIWGLHNTVLQQGHKRALVAAVRTATACSDIFTQGMLPDPTDDEGPEGHEPEAEHGPAQSKPSAAAATSQAPKSEPVKYADAIVLRDLSWAIRDSKMCEVTVSDPTKRDEAYRARRLDWINKTLSAIGQKPVEDATKITAAQAKILTELAKKGEKPEGWV
jgi:hypothetical protein